MFEFSAEDWNEGMLLRRDKMLKIAGVDLYTRVKELARGRFKASLKEVEAPAAVEAKEEEHS